MHFIVSQIGGTSIFLQLEEYSFLLPAFNGSPQNTILKQVIKSNNNEWIIKDLSLFNVIPILILMTLFLYTEERQAKFRIRLFVIWAVYGIVPTIHWVCLQDGGPIVGVMVPRIIVMYVICGAAFFFYLTKMPERLMPGLVDIFGHSHQVK